MSQGPIGWLSGTGSGLIAVAVMATLMFLGIEQQFPLMFRS
jgi:hypothetical protein